VAEKSARDITELVGQIQDEIKTLAAGITATAATALREVDNSAKVVANIEQVRVGMGELAQDSLSMVEAAQEAERTRSAWRSDQQRLEREHGVSARPPDA